MRAISVLPVVFTCLLGVAQIHCADVRGDVLWNEGLSGDISDDRLNPTAVVLGMGTNSLTATSVAGDREYITMTLPATMQLSSIVLVSYTGNDPLSFIGVQSGATFTEPPTGTVTANLLGYSHFGLGNSTVGTDILDNIATGAGAMGFAPPLPSGQYTFWIQQTGMNAVTYQLDFNVVPGAHTLGLLIVAGLAGRHRRRP